MENMRRAAYQTVFRACAFGSLAISCLMMGMAFTPRTAFQTGGVLTMLMTLILVLKAIGASSKRYSRTEMWINLAKEHRPPPATAQQLTSTVMRETYLTFALWTSMAAIGMWITALFSLLLADSCGLQAHQSSKPPHAPKAPLQPDWSTDVSHTEVSRLHSRGYQLKHRGLSRDVLARDLGGGA